MLCWGNGVSAQVPLFDSEGDRDIAEPREIECLRDRPVTEVSCGAQHSVFLLTDGTVYTCGQNDSGQLGRKTARSALDQVEALSTRTVVHVACGKHHTLALCQKGSVFAWGSGTDGQLGRGDCPKSVSQPRKVNELEVPIVQIRCGHYHSLALSRDGTVYSWGQNIYGQLGCGKGLERQQTPQRLRFLIGIPVAQIAAGESHCFSLSLSGAVYGWGRNNHGQLGLKDTVDRFNPCHVNQLKTLNVSYIACGNHHSVVLTKDGDVFTCGDGSSGQLGLVRTTNVTSFQKVVQIKDEVSQIACGSYHTLAYMPSSDTVISFGFANRENAENGSRRNQIHQESQNAKVHKIFAGANVNFIQTRPPMRAVDLRCRDRTQQILTLDETIVERWINSDEYSKERSDAENEIGLIFSSPSCLVGSFLRKSDGDQCKTGDKLLTVDMEAAREIFQKLSAKDWIVNEITSSLVSKLIPNLRMLCPDEEALMIYLILPECSVIQHKDILHLVIGFVQTIASLDTASKDTLGKYWPTLRSCYLSTLVQMIKTQVTNMIMGLHMLCQNLHQSQQLQLGQLQHNFKETLDVLEIVYRANNKSKYSIPQSNFYISEVHLFQLNIALRSREDQLKNIILMFLSYPFILDLPAKAQILDMDSQLRMQRAEDEAMLFTLHNSLTRSPESARSTVFMLKVNRRKLVADTFNALKSIDRVELQKHLMVEFEGEPGIDLGAVKKEFFECVFEEVIQPESKMFIYFQNLRIIWFPPQVSVPIKNYFLLGILCGLVMYNRCLVYIPLPLTLFKMLLGIKPALEDLSEIEPDLHRILQIILDSDKVEDLDLTCVIHWNEQEVEVLPHGQKQPLTNKNREKFVEACLNYIFKTSVKEPFDQFRRGFYHILDKKLMTSLFQPQELKDLLIGVDDYDWQMLEQNTTYKGNYQRLHPTIKIFWEVFHQLVFDEKKRFLSFTTGSDRIPVTGMRSVKITISVCSLTEDDYPEASICYNTLYLPEYTSPATLRTKLVAAINAKRTFQRA